MPRARKADIRRSNEAKILRAAEQAFARAGFAGTRTADIAALAGVPQANLHYYFKSKRDLYRSVLDNILELWLAETDVIVEGAEPRDAIEQYVRAKMRFSRLYPDASRVFANEIIHDAPEIGEYLRTGLHDLIAAKSRIIEGWIASRRMAPIEPRHLFFLIWSTTQTYADFDSQIRAVLGVTSVTDEAYAQATEQVVAFALRGCGFYYDPAS